MGLKGCIPTNTFGKEAKVFWQTRTSEQDDNYENHSTPTNICKLHTPLLAKLEIKKQNNSVVLTFQKQKEVAYGRKNHQIFGWQSFPFIIQHMKRWQRRKNYTLHWGWGSFPIFFALETLKSKVSADFRYRLKVNFTPIFFPQACSVVQEMTFRLDYHSHKISKKLGSLFFWCCV